ncbi:DEAD-domain-containing protein [Hypoxylon fragiforme]|uniref:DEAD-domain-containing protein n=1 Tax=Hypoxylon fragiforme TaxID=63214 RepID=UPI0020C686FA|nr:DEAD-domain-containing protein [Hypoxylon fragiforme]KAI2606169.1 DEAD-domain-containing protein [Hypoxylon fragiforme]
MADLASRITQPGVQASEPVAVEAEKPAEEASKLLENNYDVEVQLSDIQNNTDNPLGSVHTFDELGLPENVLKGLRALGFQKPSKVQEKALPLMLSDPPRNMIAQSQSGTGKTAAFVTTVLSRVDATKPSQPQALLLAPSRELARQIQTVIGQIGQFIPDLPVVAAIPGAIPRDTGRVDKSIVVGTPGTVSDLIKRRQFDVSQLRVLVIDEADNMLDQQGLGDQCTRVKKMLPKDVQVLLFSATFPEKVMKYATQFAPNANVIKLKTQELTVKGISQMYMDCPSEADKYDILCKLYGLMNVGSSIIFVKTRESASQIQQRMTNDGHKVSVLHGAYEGSERDALLEEFRSGRSKVLITTNVLARGIDVSTVSMVINYDIPMKGAGDRMHDTETYLHRIGRTGRFGRVGVSITFISDKKSYDALNAIAVDLGIDLVALAPDDWDETELQVQRIIKSSRAQAEFVPSG